MQTSVVMVEKSK